MFHVNQNLFFELCIFCALFILSDLFELRFLFVLMSADPWNKLPTSDSWSDQVDKEEAQNGGQLDGGSFPSLTQASRTKGKKKGVQSMSLGQFMTQDSQTGGVLRTPGGVGRSQTDTEILMSLPKQPKQKDPNDELPQRWNTKRHII